MLLIYLGLDLMFAAFHSMKSHQFFEWTRDILQLAGHTAELHMMGVRLVLTDEPENVKCIMSTKVS
jgi:hypothetical protein